MAVVLLYFNKLNPFSGKKSPRQKRETMDIWFKVVVGVLPAAVLGLLFDDWLDEHFYNYQTVAITLIIYGILFIVVENKNRNQDARISTFKELDYKTVLLIGVFQVLALIPELLFWSNYSWWYYSRYIKIRSYRVFIFLIYSSNVWC